MAKITRVLALALLSVTMANAQVFTETYATNCTLHYTDKSKDNCVDVPVTVEFNTGRDGNLIALTWPDNKTPSFTLINTGSLGDITYGSGTWQALSCVTTTGATCRLEVHTMDNKFMRVFFDDFGYSFEFSKPIRNKRR